MAIELFIRYIHFISIFVVVGSIVSEHMLLNKSVTRSTLKKLAKIDTVYGIAAIIVVLTGLTMWLWIGKGADFYSGNPVLHVKVMLFIIVGIISVFPTVFFLKNRKGNVDELIEIPNKVFWCIRLELLILFLIPICAVLMARGISFIN